jgi:hypothetical protein
VEYAVYLYLAPTLQAPHGAEYVFDVDETCLGIDGLNGSYMSGDSGAVTPVTGTVFVTQLAVTVDPTTWTLGMRPLDYVGVSGPYTIANDGNVAEDIAIKAGDGAGGWLLADARATDAFTVEADRGHDGSFELFLQKIDRLLFGNLAVGTSQTLGLRYGGPSGDSKGGGVAQNFTITFTASKYVP